MEEVIAKSVRTLYIVSYSIFIVVSIFFAGIGSLVITFADESEVTVFGWFFIVLGIVLLGASIAWLVYFIKMPKNAITLKDGKLYFRNGVVCTPTEVDSCTAKTMGLDGALFSFGKLIVVVNGKEFKLKFVDQAAAVANRVYILKAEYSVREHIAKNQNEEENREENNG